MYLCTDPAVAGYCSRAPHTSLPKVKLSSEPTSTLSPRPSARDLHTAIVWGWHLSCTHRRSPWVKRCRIRDIYKDQAVYHVGTSTDNSHSSLEMEMHRTETKKVGFLPRAMAEHMVMASAAAVASSNSEELDSCMPVRSATIVWKFSSASSLSPTHQAVTGVSTMIRAVTELISCCCD